MKALGIDLGGMRIKFGVVEDGVLLHTEQCDTEAAKGYDAVLMKMSDYTLKCMYMYPDIMYIGLGAPGLVDRARGMVRYSNNLDWENVNICHDIQERVGKKVYLANDAQCAALGEAIYGAGKEYRRVAMFTIGTGVGGGFVQDKVLEDDSCGSVSYIFGHSVVAVKGRESASVRRCNCGRYGCLEAYASASAIETNAERVYGLRKSAYEVFCAAREGEETANQIIDEFLAYLCVGVIDIANILRPEIIIIGGGVSASSDLILPVLNDALRKEVYGYDYVPVLAVSAELKNQAGIMGAVSLV